VTLHPFSIYLGRQFYTAGAKILIGGIVGDAFVINLLVDLGRPQDRFSRWQARRARTQRQMNSLWKCGGDLYIAFRQQLVTKWIVLGLMFSSVVPALIPLTFLFFFIANWVDRFNLLRHLAPPPPQDDSIMRQLVQILLPIGVLLHMAVACVAHAMKVWRRHRYPPLQTPPMPPPPHRVPDLELDLLVVNADHARAELHPDGQVVHRLEALVGELQQQARLAHAWGREGGRGRVGAVRARRGRRRPAGSRDSGRGAPVSPMMMYLKR
jgi:hypothetical protein